MATPSLQPSIDPEDDLAADEALDEGEAAVAPEEVAPLPVGTLSLPEIDVREHALPIRPGDLTRLLMAQPDLDEEDREQLARLGPLLAAVFHHEFFDRLKELKELYSPLDPDSDYIRLPNHSRDRHDDSDEEFLVPFEATLERANYRKLDTAIIEQAVAAPNETGLTYVPDFEQFEHLRLYARGYTQISRSIRGAHTKFKKRTTPTSD
jgi:hypothetical protein